MSKQWIVVALVLAGIAGGAFAITKMVPDTDLTCTGFNPCCDLSNVSGIYAAQARLPSSR